MNNGPYTESRIVTTPSVSEFVDRLKQSGLITPGKLPDIEAAADSSRDVTDEFTAKMRDGKLLTDYQIQILVSEDSQPLVIAERYEIRDKLGAGGMGEVFLARDRKLDRDVALKVLSQRMVADDDAVARFEREAKAMARLEHPGIVRAYDSGSDGDRHFLVMEFVNGASVEAQLADAGQLDPPIAADYAYQTALGLQHAHRKGLIHRDLKPSNMLVGQDGRIKILDLGLARFLQDQIDDETITVAGTGLGTPDFMAPEQFGNARNADERSDVYALGCTLYRMLAGRVPFPGSSLSQKQQDHQKKPPDPIEESAPNVPAGLAQAVYKMMAKKPDDRFQSARECAEALTPYVAASSASLPKLSGTVEWEGSQLTIVTGEYRRRRTMRWLAIGAAMAVIGVAAGFGLAQLGGNGDEDDPNQQSVAAKSAGTGDGPAKSQVKKTESKEPLGKKPAAKADPWVLTVAKDGSGQFRSIGEALNLAQPGQTIRVLDVGPYVEQIVFDQRHRGVTLEATNRAVIQVKQPVDVIHVDNVEDVTIRGFRFYVTGFPVEKRGANLVIASRNTPGLLLDDIVADTHRSGSYIFLSLKCNADRSKSPVIVRNCRINRPHIGINVNGTGVYSVSNVRLENNHIVSSANMGIAISGAVHQLSIFGNIVRNSRNAAITFLQTNKTTRNVAIANNTFFGGIIAIAVNDYAQLAKDVRIQNNLMIGIQGPDMCYVRGLSKPGATVVGLDGNDVISVWQIGHNWRESRQLPGRTPFEKGRIPVGTTDIEQQHVQGIDRNSSSPEFLRPTADSKLATDGAGKTDPALPAYVGAVPPKGVPAWDWSRTWRAPSGKNKVLTVSKDAKDGGKYRTINAALKDAKPWDTVRVLDKAVYSETVALVDAKRHAGVTVESTAGAAILLSPRDRNAVEIRDVPHVKIRGFRFLTKTGPPIDGRNFVRITGTTPGVEIADLKSRTNVPVVGVAVQSAQGTAADPIVIRNCEVTCAGDRNDGIRLYSAPGTEPSRYVRVEGNRVEGAMRAIWISYSARDVYVAGNRIFESTQSALQIENPQPDSRNVVFANNTISGGPWAFRVWRDGPQPEVFGINTECRNNLFFNLNEGDIAYRINSGGRTTAPGDHKRLLRDWNFGHNRRDVHAIYVLQGLPFAETDLKIARLQVIEETNRESADFLRPKSKSALATGGVGGDLPSYVGAVPPKGTQPWDWDITWRSRMMRAKYTAGSRSKP